MWDNRRYQTSRGIGTHSDLILKGATKSDEDLKANMTEFNEIKTNLNSIERKEGGSLLMRPLDPYVRQHDIVESDNLTTLLLVVPRLKEQEFLTTYEFLEAEAIRREKEKDEERKKKAADEEKAKQLKLEELKNNPEELAKLKKKDRFMAAQAKRDAEKKDTIPVAETEDEKKRREDDRKREDEEKKIEEKTKR